MRPRPCITGAHSAKEHTHENDDHEHGHAPTTAVSKFLHFCQENALPLLSGILVAMIMANVAPEAYDNMIHLKPFGEVSARARFKPSKARSFVLLSPGRFPAECIADLSSAPPPLATPHWFSARPTHPVSSAECKL